MMSMINPNADTPMIKMMMSERTPPTTKVDVLLSATLEEKQPASIAMDRTLKMLFLRIYYDVRII